jgi:hypothetical protein
VNFEKKILRILPATVVPTPFKNAYDYHHFMSVLQFWSCFLARDIQQQLKMSCRNCAVCMFYGSSFAEHEPTRLMVRATVSKHRNYAVLLRVYPVSPIIEWSDEWLFRIAKTRKQCSLEGNFCPDRFLCSAFLASLIFLLTVYRRSTFLKSMLLFYIAVHRYWFWRLWRRDVVSGSTRSHSCRWREEVYTHICLKQLL